jgi:hypothetical protein
LEEFLGVVAALFRISLSKAMIFSVLTNPIGLARKDGHKLKAVTKSRRNKTMPTGLPTETLDVHYKFELDDDDSGGPAAFSWADVTSLP